MDSYHDDVPLRCNYSNFSDDIERSIDELCKEKDTDDDDDFLRGAIVVTSDENHYIVIDLIATKHKSQMIP